MSNEYGTDEAVDTEMNTGVSDTDTPSPLQAEGIYLTGERPELDAEAVDVDTEMNTGVSDTDTPSPLQAEGTYLTGEGAEPVVRRDTER